VQLVAPGRPNVIGWIGEKTPGRHSLLLEGHTDVVTEGDPADWTWPPYITQTEKPCVTHVGSDRWKSSNPWVTKAVKRNNSWLYVAGSLDNWQ
jgi:hypothetical protein